MYVLLMSARENLETVRHPFTLNRTHDKGKASEEVRRDFRKLQEGRLSAGRMCRSIVNIYRAQDW